MSLRHLLDICAMSAAAVLTAAAGVEAAQLQLKKIRCVKQDITGPDEPYIKVAGQKVWGPKDMQPNMTHDLSGVAAKTFTGQVALSLYDYDTPDPDDFLGENEISDSIAGQGVKKVSITEDEAEYEIEFEAIP